MIEENQMPIAPKKPRYKRRGPYKTAATVISGAGIPIPELRAQFEARVKEAVYGALVDAHGNKSEAARALGINRTTLVQWLCLNLPELVNR